MQKNIHRPNSNEVDDLLLNAQLRDELEPYLDESVSLVDVQRMPTQAENEFLKSMLAWERAPILPISQWFNPELTLPHPDSLDDANLSRLLSETIHKLFDRGIVLELTDHLSDRALYGVLYRDILPSSEKKIDLPHNELHWHCIDPEDDPDTWLRFYATEEERDAWAEETGLPLPPSDHPPFRRKLPRRRVS